MLVFDDDARVARVLDEALSSLDCDVTLAANAKEWGEAADQGDFDVVIVDYDLGDSTGAALINSYKGGATTILFSGVDRSREVERDCPRRKPDRQLL